MIDLEDIKKDVVNRILVSSGKRLIIKEAMSGLNLIQTIVQQEIESLASKHGSAIGKLHFAEKKLVEAHQEISQLKAKLAKYESDDVVVVPRNPSDEMIDKSEWQLLDLNENVDLIYKAMIEAGEIK